MNPDTDGISNIFKSWNPMEQDYNNREFNSYDEGAGVGLNDIISQNKYPYLCFMNIPPGFTTNALNNLCSQYAKVRAVRTSKKSPYYFAEFETIADLVNVYRRLESNVFGLKVTIGREKKEKQDSYISHSLNDKIKLPSFNDETIEIEKRSIRPAKMPFDELQFKCAPLVEPDEYNKPDSMLNENDPKKQYLIEDDAHALERANLDPPPKFKDHEGNYIFRRGTKQTEMIDETKENYEKKCKESNGQYDLKDSVYKKQGTNNIAVQVLYGECEACGTTCDFSCSRCGTFYCGKECQKRNWQTHRPMCLKQTFEAKNIKSIPMERMLKKKSLRIPTTDQLEVVMPPPSDSLVVITSVCASNLVFIRSKAPMIDENYFKIISETNAAGKNMQKLTTLPKCGNIVGVQFHGQYKRAMVLSTDNPNAIRLIHVDYGNVEYESVDNLYELPLELESAHRYVVPVMLKGVPNRYMTQELRNFMYSYLYDIDLTIKYKMEDAVEIKGAFNVELINRTNNINLNKTILRISTPVDPIEGDVCLLDYLPQQYLPTGNNIDLVILDNSNLRTGVITCTKEEYALEVTKFTPELQEYAESLPEKNYAPRINELCLVKLEAFNKWYRGACLELVGDGHPSILLIDYGYITVVSIKHIRRYPPQFTFPIFAHDCEIMGLREFMDDEVEKYLETQLTKSKTICCSEIVISEEDKFYKIRLPGLLHTMKSKGLLKNRQTLYD